MERKNLLYIGAVGLILLGAGTMAITITKNNNNSNVVYGDNPYSSDPYGSAQIPYNIFEPDTLNTSSSQYAINPIWNELTKDYRPRWTGCSDKEYIQIFKDLPKMPKDFYQKYELFMKGQLTDYDRLEAEYWKQPEFYGLDQSSFNNFINRNPTMWRPGQIGCKPGFRYMELKPGAEVEISTFFHTSITGAQAYLGTVLYAHMPDSAKRLDGEIIYNQSENADKYFEYKIIEPINNEIFESASFQNKIEGKYVNVEDDERIILFEPSYKLNDVEGEKVIIGFQPNWTYKVTTWIHVKNNCPSGNYVVAVDYENPSNVIAEEYNWVITSYPYYGSYQPGFREWYPSAPYFQILITVV